MDSIYLPPESVYAKVFYTKTAPPINAGGAAKPE